METTQIVWILSPTLVIAIFTLVLVKWFLDQESRRRKQEFLMRSGETVLKHRLQAFERLALYLQRISPETLVLREQRKEMNAFQLQNHLLKTLRSEFNHNMAMQIYMPADTWELIKKAREEVARLINTTAAQVPPTVPSFELGRRIIENSGESANHAVKQALESLQKNVEELGLH
ncbi:hypothetical protein [Thermophagus xiamenensis]|jgi:hypothetical protein|uniref:Uncharacterized protein n=1 Tax=Thermophagus xiamenensis TaxID=385682 RepID=A0A1I2B5T4_9BACT|nr:hypothetical protein [Thermophagus xiamenensis]SFE51531.1 hypothetical protein SAMN05444380_112104 [Thermophagus xiamenensis]